MLFAEEELVDRHVGIGEYRGLEFLHVNARRVINEVPAASQHAVPLHHQRLPGMQPRLRVLLRAPHPRVPGARHRRGLRAQTRGEGQRGRTGPRRACARPAGTARHIAMGTNTDPYQRAEGRYHLTRGIVEALGEARNPFSILTKSTLILRDLDLLVAAAARTDVHCNLSIGTLDEEVWKATEPGHPPSRGVESRRCAGSTTPASPPVCSWRRSSPAGPTAPEQLEEVADRLCRGRSRLRDAHRAAPAPGRERALPGIHEGTPSRAPRGAGPPLRPRRVPPCRGAAGDRAARPRRGDTRATPSQHGPTPSGTPLRPAPGPVTDRPGVAPVEQLRRKPARRLLTAPGAVTPR